VRRDLTSLLLQPQADLASVLLRLGLAAIFVVHGAIKVTQDHQLFNYLSVAEQAMVGWAELIAGLLLAVGLFSRLSAVVLVLLQAGAIVVETGRYAMKGLTITQRGADYTKVGPEYNLVLITMALAVILLGSGRMSLDTWLWKWLRRKQHRTAAAPAAVEPTKPAAETAPAQEVHAGTS
jgi:putative oxidoreductase